MAESLDITSILLEATNGSSPAADQLFSALYPELRQRAALLLRRERPGHTLRPTDLVHEAYLRLADQSRCRWQDRAHFLAVASQAMRRILVDHARRRTAQKRGRQHQITLDTAAQDALPTSSDDILGVDEALERLALLDARQARVVELRYFVGLSIEETAEVIGTSIATVKRDWMVARAWLQRELSPAG